MDNTFTGHYNDMISCPICGNMADNLTIRIYGKCNSCRRKPLGEEPPKMNISIDPFRKSSGVVVNTLQEEIKELKKLLLTPQQLITLALFIENKQNDMTSSLLHELTPRYLRNLAKAIELFNEEE